MMTKKQICRMIVDNAKDDVINQTDESLVKDIFGSTTLGIALEFLGVITPNKYPTEYEYLSHRAGVLYGYFDRNTMETYQLSFRELLSLLPDEIVKEEK